MIDGDELSVAPSTAASCRSVMPDRRALGGILVRRECWTLSLPGKLLASSLTLVAALALVRGLYPFLAVTSRTSGEIMVVEGWIHTDSIAQAAKACKAGDYQEVVVVKEVRDGGNKWDSGRYIADELVRLGVPKDRVFTVSCEVFSKDRTYHSALAVKRWLQEQGMPAKSIDVVTIGPHARRSRLLFKKAFGRQVDVGVIAMDEQAYDLRHWWRSSEGVREVLFEGVAYLYALLFFCPS
jgi:uncharacterized SAM-binding protein YcdF (DUF218 family)